MTRWTGRFALVTAASGLGKLTVEDVIKLVDNRGCSCGGSTRWMGRRSGWLRPNGLVDEGA